MRSQGASMYFPIIWDAYRGYYVGRLAYSTDWEMYE